MQYIFSELVFPLVVMITGNVFLYWFYNRHKDD